MYMHCIMGPLVAYKQGKGLQNELLVRSTMLSQLLSHRRSLRDSITGDAAIKTLVLVAPKHSKDTKCFNSKCRSITSQHPLLLKACRNQSHLSHVRITEYDDICPRIKCLRSFVKHGFKSISSSRAIQYYLSVYDLFL